MNNLRGLFGLTRHLLPGNANACRHVSPIAIPTSTPSISAALINFAQLRFKPKFPKIRGGGRPLPPNVVKPESSKYNWLPIYPPDGKYTIQPLKIRKLAGRHPETGRVVVKTCGGGLKKYFRWIDYWRRANPDGTPREERVFKIRYDPLRSTQLALVAGGDYERWIMATEKMRVGDVIRTYSDIPRNPVRPREGDSHPIGALPIGTKVHNVQLLPTEEKSHIKYAGQFATLTKRVGRRNYLADSRSTNTYCILDTCMVTVGRLSNPYHDTVNLMCAQRSRWLGKRPRSGGYHKKDGYCGRKIKPPPPVRDLFATAMAAQKSGKTLNPKSFGGDAVKETYVLESF